MSKHMQTESRGTLLSRAVRVALLAPFICFLPSIEQAQTPAANADDIAAPVKRFEGTADFKGNGGATKHAAVTIRQWTVPGKQKIEALAERGFLLVTVRAGKVTTTIAGKEEQRVTNDFWTVPENAKMSVEAAGEAAVLEVVSFNVR